jgi:hypothetical protein
MRLYIAASFGCGPDRIKRPDSAQLCFALLLGVPVVGLLSQWSGGICAFLHDPGWIKKKASAAPRIIPARLAGQKHFLSVGLASALLWRVTF